MDHPDNAELTSTRQDPGRQLALALDAADPLCSFREQFHRPDGAIYMDGNSLGLLSREAEAAVLRALNAWRTMGIHGWKEGEAPWLSLPRQLSARIAPLLGAHPEEVILANSTTVNLHQLLATLYQPSGARAGIVADALAFPSDLYALRSHLRTRGLDEACLKLVPPRGRLLHEEDFEAAMTPQTALLVVPSVVYTTGQRLDIGRLARAAQVAGAAIAVDCSHSIGCMPHTLHADGVDCAFFCTYKHLNGGPGSVGGLFLHRKRFGMPPGLAGWFGCESSRQFQMLPQFLPAEGAAALQIGTPHILSLAALEGSLRMVESAGIERIRAKSLSMTDYMLSLWRETAGQSGLGLVTPEEQARRGAHLAFAHAAAEAIVSGLRVRGVVADFRPPDMIRVSPAPIYTTYTECWETMARLVETARTVA